MVEGDKLLPREIFGFFMIELDHQNKRIALELGSTDINHIDSIIDERNYLGRKF